MTGGTGPLSGRVAVVTGGNRGIGRAIAIAMAQAGAAVAVGTRDPATREAVERDLHRELGEHGGDVEVTTCDVTDEASLARFAGGVLERWGRVDAVVANAGTAGPTAPLHEVDPVQWRACIEADLTSVYLTFRCFVPPMLAQGSGSLIAVSSVTAKRPLPGRTAYAAAKMGIIGLVRTLAVELGPYGVRANTVCPGSVDGPRLDRVIAADAAARGISQDAVRREHAGPAALQRLVRADEVAAACVFLAGDGASAITGEDLNVSAGAVMH